MPGVVASRGWATTWRRHDGKGPGPYNGLNEKLQEKPSTKKPPLARSVTPEKRFGILSYHEGELDSRQEQFPASWRVGELDSRPDSPTAVSFAYFRTKTGRPPGK